STDSFVDFGGLREGNLSLVVATDRRKRQPERVGQRSGPKGGTCDLVAPGVDQLDEACGRASIAQGGGDLGVEVHRIRPAQIEGNSAELAGGIRFEEAAGVGGSVERAVAESTGGAHLGDVTGGGV